MGRDDVLKIEVSTERLLACSSAAATDLGYSGPGLLLLPHGASSLAATVIVVVTVAAQVADLLRPGVAGLPLRVAALVTTRPVRTIVATVIATMTATAAVTATVQGAPILGK
jgi:hypothetical protein